MGELFDVSDLFEAVEEATDSSPRLPKQPVKPKTHTGLCGECCEPIIADQPGGRNVRHVDGRPYDGKCRKARA